MTAFWIYTAALLGSLRIVAIVVAVAFVAIGLIGIVTGSSPAQLTQARRRFLIRKGRTCLVVALFAVVFAVIVPAQETVREMAGLSISEKCE